MLKEYEKFISELDNILNEIFESQKEYIFCKKGCSKCCEKGNYPLSQTEFAYITEGYIKISEEKKIIVQNNIKTLLDKKQKNNEKIFEHQCPFLINNECCVYKYRGIICRTFGICYYDDKNGYVRLPECVHDGLNYSKQYESETNLLNLENVPMINLRTDSVLESQIAKKYKIKSGEIRPMLDWIITNKK